MQAKLSTESSVTPNVTLTGTATEVNGWTVCDFDLSSLNGNTIYMIGFNVRSTANLSNYSLNIGQVAVLPVDYTPAPVQVTDLSTTSTLGEESGDIRITWKYTWNNNFDHFDIYTQTMDGQKTLVGQTRDEGFYIPPFDRNGSDSYISVFVVPVMKDGVQQAPSELQVNCSHCSEGNVFCLSEELYSGGRDGYRDSELHWPPNGLPMDIAREC